MSDEVNLISSHTILRQEVNSFNNNPAKTTQAKLNTILSDTKTSVKQIHRVSIVANNGTIIASTDATLIGEKRTNPNYQDDDNKTPAVVDIYKVSDGQVLLRMAAPLLLENKIVGVLYVVWTAEDIMTITNDYTGLGETGETVIGKMLDNGDIVPIVPLRYNSNAALTQKVRDDQKSVAPLAIAVQGNEKTIMNALDYRGEEVITVTRFIEDVNWGVLTKIDASEVYQPMNRLRTVLILAIITSLLSAFLISHIVKTIRQTTIEDQL